MSRINLSIAIVAIVQTVRSGQEMGIVSQEPFCLRGNDSLFTYENLATTTAAPLPSGKVNQSVDFNEVTFFILICKWPVPFHLPQLF